MYQTINNANGYVATIHYIDKNLCDVYNTIYTETEKELTDELKHISDKFGDVRVIKAFKLDKELTIEKIEEKKYIYSVKVLEIITESTTTLTNE